MCMTEVRYSGFHSRLKRWFLYASDWELYAGLEEAVPDPLFDIPWK